MSLLRQAFITLFIAVRCSQVLSEETFGYFKTNCHCARLHWSALNSGKIDVWERSEGIRLPCGKTNVLSTVWCDDFAEHNHQSLCKCVSASMFYFPKEFILGFSQMNLKCNHYPHTLKLMKRYYFLSINTSSQWLNYCIFTAMFSMMYKFDY